MHSGFKRHQQLCGYRSGYRVLKELKTGAKSTSVCRKYRVSESTLYNWQSKYGDLEASDLAKLRQIEDEIAGSRGSSPTKSSKSKRSRLSSRETSKAQLRACLTRSTGSRNFSGG